MMKKGRWSSPQTTMKIVENLQIWSASVRCEDSERIKTRFVMFADASPYTVWQLSSKTEREWYVIKDWREPSRAA